MQLSSTLLEGSQESRMFPNFLFSYLIEHVECVQKDEGVKEIVLM